MCSTRISSDSSPPRCARMRQEHEGQAHKLEHDSVPVHARRPPRCPSRPAAPARSARRHQNWRASPKGRRASVRAHAVERGSTHPPGRSRGAQEAGSASDSGTCEIGNPARFPESLGGLQNLRSFRGVGPGGGCAAGPRRIFGRIARPRAPSMTMAARSGSFGRGSSSVIGRRRGRARTQDGGSRSSAVRSYHASGRSPASLAAICSMARRSSSSSEVTTAGTGSPFPSGHATRLADKRQRPRDGLRGGDALRGR